MRVRWQLNFHEASFCSSEISGCGRVGCRSNKMINIEDNVGPLVYPNAPEHCHRRVQGRHFVNYLVQLEEFLLITAPKHVFGPLYYSVLLLL